MLSMSPELKSVYQTLMSFLPMSPSEAADQQVMASYFRCCPDLLARDNEKVHITSSAFIVNQDRTKGLMIYHNTYNSWSWLGNHADGSGDLLSVAVEKVRSETGCCAEPLSGRPISVEIMPVPTVVRSGKVVPEHQHLNLTFLLQGDDNQKLCLCHDEGSDIAWFDLDQIPVVTTEEAMKPVYRKIIRHIREDFPDNLEAMSTDSGLTAWEQMFRNRLGNIFVDTWEHLPQIAFFPSGTAQEVLYEVLATGCIGHSRDSMTLAQKALTLMPSTWVDENIPVVAPYFLSHEGAWNVLEFKKLGQLLSSFPNLVNWLSEAGASNEDPAIQEVASAL